MRRFIEPEIIISNPVLTIDGPKDLITSSLFLPCGMLGFGLIIHYYDYKITSHQTPNGKPFHFLKTDVRLEDGWNGVSFAWVNEYLGKEERGFHISADGLSAWFLPDENV